LLSQGLHHHQRFETGHGHKASKPVRTVYKGMALPVCAADDGSEGQVICVLPTLQDRYALKKTGPCRVPGSVADWLLGRLHGQGATVSSKVLRALFFALVSLSCRRKRRKRFITEKPKTELQCRSSGSRVPLVPVAPSKPAPVCQRPTGSRPACA
jgi:hypothetical protein